MIEAVGRGEWLSGLGTDLIEKTYRPAPVRRVLIPKPGGGERQRKKKKMIEKKNRG